MIPATIRWDRCRAANMAKLAPLAVKVAGLIGNHEQLVVETDAVIDEAFAGAAGTGTPAGVVRQCTIDARASRGYSYLTALRLLEQYLKGQRRWDG